MKERKPFDNYIQTYDFNTAPAFPIVGVSSINAADVGYGTEGDGAADRTNHFEEYIKDIIKESPASSAEFAQGIGNNTNNVGGEEKFVYVSNGKITATNTNIGNSSTPIYLKDGVFTACTEMAPGGITEIPVATSSILGGIKTGYQATGQNYPVILDNNNNAYVYVPQNEGGTSVSYSSGTEDISMGQSVTIGTITIDGTPNPIKVKMPIITTNVDNKNATLVSIKSVTVASINDTEITITLPPKPDAGGTAVTEEDIASWGFAYKTDIPTNYIKTDIASRQELKGELAAPDFITTSDERLKTFKDNISIDFNKIKEIPKKYFTFNDDPDKVRIGTSAQQLQKVYPELVVYDESNDSYHVNYANLSVVALAAIDRLHEEIEYLKDKINKLENGRG